MGKKGLNMASKESYDSLSNLPSINGVTLEGNLTTQQLNVDKHFKGWWPDLATLKAAITATAGDAAYVKDASPATTWSIYVYDSTASSDNYWADSGTDADTSNVQTFASGEEVNETYIDDTHLVNPVDGALSTAYDALQLKAKLEGVTAEETKAVLTILSDKKVSVDGTISNSAGESVAKIDVQGIRKARFWGYRAGSAHTYGFCVYSSATTLDTTTLVASGVYDSNGSSGNYFREYSIDIPSNGVTLVVMYNKSNFQSLQPNFYCFLTNGTTVDNVRLRLNTKTEQITLEDKTLPFIIHTSNKVNKNGVLQSTNSAGNHVAEVNILGYSSVRFNSITIASKNFNDQDTYPNFYSFGHYDSGSWVVDEIGLYDTNTINSVSRKEYIVPIPEKATHLLVMAGVSSIGDDGFYVYGRKGNDVSSLINESNLIGESYKLEQLDLSNDQYISAYMSLDGDVASSSIAKVYYRPVFKGERYMIYATPNENYLNNNNNVVVAYRRAAPPVVGDTLSNNLAVVSGVIYSNLGTTGADHKPTAVRLEWMAPNNGYMVYYCQVGSDLMIYRKNVLKNAEYGIFDTYIEEDVFKKQKYIKINSGSKVQKTYLLKPGIEYKAIYVHSNGVQYDSWVIYDAQNNVLSSSGDSSEQGRVEHIMEDVTIPQNAHHIVFSFYATSEHNAGTIDRGMGALMKPLRNDGTMPMNDFIYCVSRVKANPMASDIDSSTPASEDSLNSEYIWSAWGARLPQGHSLFGRPAPLCSYFHGTGGKVTSECLGYVYAYGTKMQNLLYDNGIAMFDVNGRGVSFTDDKDSISGVALGERTRHWGNPAALATAKKAYEVLVNRLNCARGMVVGGCSMGGCLVESYCNTYPQDVVASFAAAPALLGLEVRSTTYLGGTDNAVAWGATGDNIGNPSLMIGYSQAIDITEEVVENDMKHLVRRSAREVSLDDFLGSSTKNFLIPFPKEFVIWQGTEDTNVSPERRIGYVRAMRNAGSNVKLRLCNGYAHPLMDFFGEMVDYVKSKLVI